MAVSVGVYVPDTKFCAVISPVKVAPVKSAYNAGLKVAAFASQWRDE